MPRIGEVLQDDADLGQQLAGVQPERRNHILGRHIGDGRAIVDHDVRLRIDVDEGNVTGKVKLMQGHENRARTGQGFCWFIPS